MFRHLKFFASAAIVLVFTASSASAAYVDWRGSAQIWNLSAGCTSLGMSENDYMPARYRHPNLGTNGSNAQLSFFPSMWAAFNFTSLSGNLPTSKTRVLGTSVGGGATRYRPFLWVTSMSPAAGTIDQNTQVIKIIGRIVNFGNFAKNPLCAVTFGAIVTRH